VVVVEGYRPLRQGDIYRLIAENRLRSIRIDGRTIIPADSLHALMTGEAA
jgi:hypothetical protein